MSAGTTAAVRRLHEPKRASAGGAMPNAPSLAAHCGEAHATASSRGTRVATRGPASPSSLRQPRHVLGGRPLVAIDDIERHALTLIERRGGVTLNGGSMDEA